MRQVVSLALTVLSAALLLAPHGSVHAQAPDQPERSAAPFFRSRADLVVLHVNVFNGRSGAVPDLPREAFQVIDEGRPQQITFFRGTDVPVAVGLVIDNSTSMLTRRPMVLAGGRTFVESSHPEDELFTVIFNEHVRMGLPDGVAFTQSRPLLESTLFKYPAGGRTALYDGVFNALEHLDGAMHQKRVLVVLSDGGDNASRRSRADMLRRASRSDALIYTIWTGDLAGDRGDRGVLRELSRRSGGLAYTPESEAETVSAFKQIAENVRRGYSIGFVPSNAKAGGEYHRLQVMVRMPGQTLTALTREGYTEAGGPEDEP